jgi:hypothetical protein
VDVDGRWWFVDYDSRYSGGDIFIRRVIPARQITPFIALVNAQIADEDNVMRWMTCQRLEASRNLVSIL